jgi:hypothetical protein
MSTLSLNVRYRPLRIGWCVRQGDLEGFEKALRLSHTLWGGSYNPIIPVGDGRLSERIVNAFGVDLLYAVSDDLELDQFVNKFPHLQWPLGLNGLYVNSRATLLDIYHPARSIVEENRHLIPDLRIHLYDWQDDDPLKHVLLATVGHYPVESAESPTFLKYEVMLEQLGVEKVVLTPDTPLPVTTLQAVTPNALTAIKLEVDFGRNWGMNNAGLYVGNAQDFDDLVNVWNLRAAGVEVLFCDPSHAERFRTIKDEWLRLLEQHAPIPTPQGPELPRYCVWTKFSEVNLDRSVFPQRIVHATLTDTYWGGMNLQPATVHFGNASVLGTRDQTQGRLSVAFQLPAKPFETDDINLSMQHLVTSVSPIGDIWLHENMTLRAPYLPRMNNIFGSSFQFVNDVRVEKDRFNTRLGIIDELDAAQETLWAVRQQDLIQHVFESFGINAKTSQPGLLCSRLIQQLGELRGCRVFKIAGARKLIRDHKTDESFTRRKARQIIGQGDSTSSSHSFSMYKDLRLDEQQDGELTQDHVLAYLLTKGVFRVGFLFRCDNCTLEFWTALDETKTMTKCEYCGYENNITPQLKDGIWHYRRSGVFGRNDNQGGGIAVALVLQQLQRYLGFDKFSYATALELTPAGAPIRNCETDFAVLTRDIESKPQLVIGETKTQGEIRDEDVANLKQVADAIPHEELETFIVFAKLKPFTGEEIQRCRAANGAYQNRVILLSPRELEPENMYELARQQFELRDYTYTSLADAANATQDIYFTPRPRSKN